MEHKEFLELMNSFVRVHNQFSAVKRGQVCSIRGETLYPAEMHVITLLAQRPGIGVSEISDALYITRSAASQMVKKLVGKGFLDKTRNPDNERSVILNVTGRGEQAIRDFLGSESQSLNSFVKELALMEKDELLLAQQFLKRLEVMFEEKLARSR